MNVDDEMKELRQRWEQERIASETKRAQALKAKLAMRREALLKEGWKPDCTCDNCLRAVLTMDPSLVCADGKNRGQWWKL